MDEERVDSEVVPEEESFFLDSEPEDTGAADEAGVEENPPGFTIEEVPEKKGSSRLLLLLLLLVALGGGFYFFGQEALESHESVVTVRMQKPTKMKVPARPQPTKQAEAVKEEVVAKEVVASVAPKKAAAKAPPAAPAPLVKKTPVSAPAFTLASDSYLYRGALRRDSALIEKMGYKVTQTQKLEPHKMTRLLVGLYPKKMAQKRLAAIKKLADGAFLVAESGKYAVYAGSYLSLDKARREADRLYAQGIRVEERQVQIDLPRTSLRFGSFSSRSDAQAAREKLQKAGVAKLKVVELK